MKATQKLKEAIDAFFVRGCTATELYTRLLLECIRANDLDQVKRLQSHVEMQSVEPNNTYLQNRLLHLYVKSGKTNDALTLFDKMPSKDVFSWNVMLSAYSKMGETEKLQATFDKMPARDCISYNTTIAGLVGSGCCVDGLGFFVRMQRDGFEPSEYTYVSALNACSKLLDLRRGKQIHGRTVTSSSCKGNVFVSSALMDMYAKCGQVDQARWLFDQLSEKNVVLWNSMISGYLKNGCPEKCLDLFLEMKVAGVKPDLVTVSSVLGANFKSGFIDEATRIFKEIKEKDGVCWTTMIVGYAQNNKEEDAWMLFSEMLSENVKPDQYTISSVVSVCARLASLVHGKVIHSKAIHYGIESDLLVSSALIDMYSKCGETLDARKVFRLMPIRNVVSWNAMMTGYAQNGQDQEALELYQNMLQEKLKPDNITLVGVLYACSRSGSVELGKEYFSSISESHGMKPTLDHYSCMINLLGRPGRMDEAVDLINSLPEEPNYLIWSTLLSVARVNGDIERAEMAAKHLSELDPLETGPYIILSNMYASAGRWGKVALVRSLMKDKKIRKAPAYSWIEIDYKVHKFVSDDRSHLQNEEIYRKLDSLMKEIQKAGYVPDRHLALHDVGEDEKVESISYHSEKLALAYGLISKPHDRMPIRILKNLRVCKDCHMFMKFVSKLLERRIILRDSNLFHHFVDGQCSCKDYW
ncbi:pentatricopeptide repeat-containing protein At2g22070-like [Papaver somniferum]|uniref:pentatricopeptide repeat-containing protein At2g22070-like n=1 Tax=Papaver somniferum TaxID=3469 RepID=UPI000E6FC53B|nr:pentatricopeptide repeat-containing protein At2g22070-like [Papaver somniferum]XP_026442075.1 pentatricopeptide repeat-containing protein At2g22070-like [Papaver somniferum]